MSTKFLLKQLHKLNIMCTKRAYDLLNDISSELAEGKPVDIDKINRIKKLLKASIEGSNNLYECMMPKPLIEQVAKT